MGNQRSALSEVARRRVLHAEEYYDRLEYELDPLGGYRLRRNQRLPHITINGQGFRGEPFTGEEPVLLLGDSVTFGVGAGGDEERFSRFLSQAIGRPVADASVRAYRVFQQYGQLPSLLERLPRVRWVIVWFGYADLLFWMLSGGCVEGAFQFEKKYGASSGQSNGSLPGWSRLARLLGVPASSGRFGKEDRARETGSVEDLAAHVALYLQAIRDLCGARGIEVRNLLQPFVRRPPQEEELKFLADSYDEKSKQRCGVGWYEASDRFTRALQKGNGEGRSPRILDCQGLVTEEIFLDQVHLKVGGLERLASRLAEGEEWRSIG